MTRKAACIRFQASRNGAIISDYTGAVYNYDLADRGSPVRLTFGLAGIADNAYYPPVGLEVLQPEDRDHPLRV